VEAAGAADVIAMAEVLAVSDMDELSAAPNTGIEVL